MVESSRAEKKFVAFDVGSAYKNSFTPAPLLPAPMAPRGVIGGGAQSILNFLALSAERPTRFILFTTDLTPWSTANIFSFKFFKAFSLSLTLPSDLPILSGGRPV